MRPSDGKISLWPVAIILFVLVLVSFSINPALTLKSVPPSDFIAVRASSATPPQAALAAAYWQAAVRVIQWKYNRGNELPAQVPEDFRALQDPEKPVAAEDRAARAAYWAKLREEWLLPENWETNYNLDLSWPVRIGRSLSLEIWNFIHQS